jgi:phospholipase C
MSKTISIKSLLFIALFSIVSGRASAQTGLSVNARPASQNSSDSTESFANKPSVEPASTILLTVKNPNPAGGSIVSKPAGINCGTTCSASFPSGTAVTLTATPISGSKFAEWSGGCGGATICAFTLKANTTVSAIFNAGPGSITSLNHIVYLSQENRSLDNYFGALREYWALNGYPDQSFDGLPQFNPSSGPHPLGGPAPALAGCNPADLPPADCIYDATVTVPSFHLETVCTENTSPSWNEAHVDWDFFDQVGKYPAKNNGFVKTAAHDARTIYPAPYFDTDGIRAMGYYNGNDLNYDYFMATNFATSDRFFQPAMTRTNPNREYLVAATSGGYAYPNGAYPADTPLLKSKTIFEELTDAGISWKIYVNPEGSACTGPVYQASCLFHLTYIQDFTYGQTVLKSYPQNIAPISEYFSDLANGTLPQVAQIEPGSEGGLDEHGTDSDKGFPTNVQLGVRYVSTLINSLMESSSWNDSVFILTYDESGGLYDHVSPQPAVSPDGIKPVDLPPDSVCYKAKGPTCDFVWTGGRVPLIVVSPFAKQNYVSHTVMDETAILKLIETRFNLPALNKRDAAQPNMTEFFNFTSPPWVKPPTPPTQNTSNPCYLNRLP